MEAKAPKKQSSNRQSKSQQELDRLRKEMEKVRRQLYDALDLASGELSDETVQQLARQFDELLTEYVHIQRVFSHETGLTPASCSSSPATNT